MAEPYTGNKQVGAWDYAGSMATGEYRTLSLGIFQVEKKSKGERLKRGKVQIRVYGTRENRSAVFMKAQDICDALNTGVNITQFQKNVTVK